MVCFRLAKTFLLLFADCGPWIAAPSPYHHHWLIYKYVCINYILDITIKMHGKGHSFIAGGAIFCKKIVLPIL